jgi:hypothetical protein
MRATPSAPAATTAVCKAFTSEDGPGDAVDVAFPRSTH